MFSDFITEKTPRGLALAVGVSVFTVYSWRRRNSVPTAYWPALMRAYRGLRIEQLLAMDQAGRAAA